MALPLILPFLGMGMAGAASNSPGARQRAANRQRAADLDATRQQQVIDQAGQAFPLQQALRQQQLDAGRQAFDQNAALHPLQLAAAQQSIQQGQFALDRSRQMLPGELEGQRLELEDQAAQNAFNAAANPLRMNNLALTNMGLAQGLQPSQAVPETVPAINPLNGLPDNIPIAGAEYNQRQANLDHMYRGLQQVNQMIGLIDEFGSEMGGEAAVTMANLRTGILFSMVQARGGGAPQGVELELVAEGLPDPTSLGANIRGLANIAAGPFYGAARANQEESISSGYEQFALQLSQAIRDELERTPSLRLDNFNTLDPRVFSTPDEREYFRQNSGQAFITGGQ